MSGSAWQCKTCARCGAVKPLPDFGLRAPGKPHSWCHDCRREYAREWYQANRESELTKAARKRSDDPDSSGRDRAAALKYRFGLTGERYDEMLAAQGGGCAICGASEPGGHVTNFVVDHDHDCCNGPKSCGGCVRGLLCVNCNWGLGQFRDSVESLASAIEYLEAARG